jgi:hydrogenase/urease accessory protein HupE
MTAEGVILEGGETMLKRVATVAVTWLALCSAAAAHPGHGRDGGDFSPLHYLTEPDHLVVGIPLAALLGLGVWYLAGARRAKARARALPEE